ncbi:zinc-binding dehydrogenase [Salinisphaera sp. USBA-960]|nr:zinc-binding dehydrogenase [Salifodinibacter halophilus]NNC27103.1 zinc-binding dehydrogenase [Salifodinibacter halophilus]
MVTEAVDTGARVPATMAAMQLTGHGGLEQLVYRDDVPVPVASAGEVVVEVTATAKNNTDRKAREGLYATGRRATTTSFAVAGDPTLVFPRIQGADIVGRIAAVGSGVDPARIGERGLLDFNIYADDRRDINLMPDYYGHGADGGFAEYVAVPADQFHGIDDAQLTDAELASLGMCSYQTAYHMLTAADVAAGEYVLVTGASGGVGTALIQLCRVLGAVPIALSMPEKAARVHQVGAEVVLDRSQPESLLDQVREATGGAPIDAVMDLLGGTVTESLIATMTFDMRARATYPRLSIAGASAGRATELPWALVYLYQVRIVGVSHGTRAEAEQLIEWIRMRRLAPILHGTFRLSALREAEQYFADQSRQTVGKIVIVPDRHWATHGAPYALADTP